MQSKAKTVDQYLSELPKDRRGAIETVRSVILKNLPKGYEEAMNWGMITYQVPKKTYPDTYNGEPLMYAALASQKRHMAVYLMSVYMSEKGREAFETAYHTTGKPLDMGKSCVRFKKLEDLPLELVGEAISKVGVADYIDGVKSARTRKNKTKQ